MNANLQKASRWWKARDSILAETEEESSFNIMSHRQLGVRKKVLLKAAAAYHMGVLCRGFQSGELDENLQENIDETHFIVNMDNGKTVGFRGDETVKYADVVSGGVAFTMVVKVTSGRWG
ncbi:hypothetical protein R1sor_020067 [Riccia sorocarpa]|uniref:Uncharacterized protein n=1 Tax=Riccia sorocarpa TaxID=122646 RepID=A0ABD3IE89_9MARC